MHQPDTLSPEIIKTKTFTAFAHLFTWASRQAPLLIAVEEMQWINKTSKDILSSLVESLGGVPMLFLSTHRPGYRP